MVAAAKRTKKCIDVQYSELVKNLEEIDKLEPETFMQRFENEVSAYFTALHRTIKEVEKELITRIKASQNLKMLKGSLDALLNKINHAEMAKLEEEKKKIDSRIEANRYAFIAQREKDYIVVEDDFKRVNKFLSEKIASIRQYERDMYVI